MNAESFPHHEPAALPAADSADMTSGSRAAPDTPRLLAIMANAQRLGFCTTRVATALGLSVEEQARLEHLLAAGRGATET
ncbi:MAG: hypothetical protein ACR2LK_03200 [Solirubrobacteraceae bacterium]